MVDSQAQQAEGTDLITVSSLQIISDLRISTNTIADTTAFTIDKLQASLNRQAFAAAEPTFNCMYPWPSVVLKLGTWPRRHSIAKQLLQTFQKAGCIVNGIIPEFEEIVARTMASAWIKMTEDPLPSWRIVALEVATQGIVDRHLQKVLDEEAEGRRTGIPFVPLFETTDYQVISDGGHALLSNPEVWTRLISNCIITQHRQWEDRAQGREPERPAIYTFAATAGAALNDQSRAVEKLPWPDAFIPRKKVTGYTSLSKASQENDIKEIMMPFPTPIAIRLYNALTELFQSTMELGPNRGTTEDPPPYPYFPTLPPVAISLQTAINKIGGLNPADVYNNYSQITNELLGSTQQGTKEEVAIRNGKRK